MSADLSCLAPIGPCSGQARTLVATTPAAIARSIAGEVSKARKILVVCRDESEVEKLLTDLEFFLPKGYPLIHLPNNGLLPFEVMEPQSDIIAERLATIWQLANAREYICVTDVDALVQKALSADYIASKAFQISAATPITKLELSAKLSQLGFRKVNQVMDVGQFAVQGGIIDIYSDKPIRIEFQFDNLSGLRIFNVDTQRSHEQISSALLLPVREFLMPEADALPYMMAGIQARADQLDVPSVETSEVLRAISSAASMVAVEEQSMALLTKFVGYAIDGNYSSPINALPSDATLIIVGRELVTERLTEYKKQITERDGRYRSEHRLNPPVEMLFDHNIEVELYKRAKVIFGYTGDTTINISPIPPLADILRAGAGKGGALKPLVQYILSERDKLHKVIIACRTKPRAERMSRLLGEHNLYLQLCDSAIKAMQDAGPHGVFAVPISLSSGFTAVDDRITFVSEDQIFNLNIASRRQTKHRRRVTKLLNSIARLKKGDYVVHEDYGVGIYHGLLYRQVEKAIYDFVVIEYFGSSRLYLPVDSIGKIEKYSAAEGTVPQLDKLGSIRWARTKAKVRASVVELAGDLINLYAAREQLQGWRFEPFGSEDERFAESFPFDETTDQAQAIQDTLHDMSKDKPMDRLVCGDVGFGKTEVALRAAFKATQHAKQVAILAPTTLLVEQHYRTFVDRFVGYDVKIEAISRQYSSKQIGDKLKKLAIGEIDIIIGTHRLLQTDVVFKDLGLVIVDEEQRFGVKQKERLKRLRESVDILTLTATPIPRTLQMSLYGIRDLSVIATPPANRRAIKSQVTAFDILTIKDAIAREVERGGQVFFLHNEISTLPGFTDRLRDEMPNYRFEYAHGQMESGQMESVMTSFLRGEVDVLVSTTIIESGLDIPNANTIIVENAHKLGLAQAYQIRGRVGRSAKQAYAYFLLPERLRLTSHAEQRLAVLGSLNELAVGFNLAVRDLEIRGAGNLLGKEQSGNVAAVGLELYYKIIHEVIAGMRGKKILPDSNLDPEIRLGTDAYLREDYVMDVSERLMMYQRLSQAKEITEVDAIAEEIADRFGILPPEGQALIEQMRWRVVARKHGIRKIERDLESDSAGKAHKAQARYVLYFTDQASAKKLGFNPSKNGVATAYDLKLTSF